LIYPQSNAATHRPICSERQITSMPIRSLNIVHAVVNEHGAIFNELIEIVSESLQNNGVVVSRTTNKIIANQINLFIGATIALPQELFKRLREFQQTYIIYQLEPLDHEHGYLSRFPHYLDFLRGAKQVWDYSQQNTNYLARLGMTNVRYIPVGHSFVLERIVDFGQGDIDVLFYGAISTRRRQILDELQRQGLKVAVLFRKYGPFRDSYIGRTKVVLNVHQFETSHLEQLRISYLLNNERFVISESSSENPFGDGVIFCHYEDIVTQCKLYLRNGMEAERRRIAKAGYDAIKKIPMTTCIAEAVQGLSAD
jgi:hypothetical protein